MSEGSDLAGRTWDELAIGILGSVASLRDLNPGNWTIKEWPALLAGTLGPWAMANGGR